MPPTPPGSVPPPHGFPPPSGGQSGYPGPAYPPQSWQQPRGPKRGSGWKWAFGIVALVAVIGVTAAVTLSVADKGDKGGTSPTGASPSASGVANSDVASANDTGPVAVITEDPSCAAQRPILATLTDEAKKGWNSRDIAIPATAWTPETRAMYTTYTEALNRAADQVVPLARLTPHRVMRELYEQFIAYSRSYVDSISNYTQPDDYLARVSIAVSDAISYICAAIDYGSAASRAPLISEPAAPSAVPPVTDPAHPARFLLHADPICADWSAALSQFQSDTEAWRRTNPDIPAGQWTPEQRAINDEVGPVMERFAGQLTAIGERTENLILRDFANLASQYRRAYVAALPTYLPADKYLATASIRLVGVVQGACQAVAD